MGFTYFTHLNFPLESAILHDKEFSFRWKENKYLRNFDNNRFGHSLSNYEHNKLLLGNTTNCYLSAHMFRAK